MKKSKTLSLKVKTHVKAGAPPRDVQQMLQLQQKMQQMGQMIQ